MDFVDIFKNSPNLLKAFVVITQLATLYVAVKLLWPGFRWAGTKIVLKVKKCLQTLKRKIVLCLHGPEVGLLDPP